MLYNKINKNILNEIEEFIDKKNIFSDKENLYKYSKDETEDLTFLPELVIKVENAYEISKILKIANKYKIPVTPRGAGTGLSGGALAVYGGIVISLEKLNKILEIDEDNFQATVEPGVITQEFQEAVEEKGLFYPPDPASRGSCFIGGNLAENSGGPRAVKYGVTSNYVLDLEVVLPNGEIINTGAKTIKNVTGYNLTQLFIGSEGTLGIITKAVFRLLPLPAYTMLILAAFDTYEKACKSINTIMKSGILPSALEFMEKDAIDMAINFLKINLPIATDKKTKALLLIEIDGNDKNLMFKDCEKISNLLSKNVISDILFAENEYEKEQLWKIRRCIAEAVKVNSVYKEEDTVVPRAKLPELINFVKKIGEKYSFRTVCYGHAGDGDLHVNILKDNMSNEEWNNKLLKAIKELFKQTVKLGGTISGEHGIGLVQKPYINLALSKENIKIQKNIKKIFDPNNILNPGKIFLIIFIFTNKFVI